MRFLLLNTDYEPFIQWLYSQNPGLEKCGFEEQYQARMHTMFGTADFYSQNLRALGHEAWDIIANLEPAQRQWAREHRVRIPDVWRTRFRRGIVPWPYRDTSAWLYTVLAAQIKEYRPDILYIMCMETIDSDFLRHVQGYYRLAVGQHAATPLKVNIGAYDLVLSSLPNQVDNFRKQGLRSELFKLGFQPAVLERLERRQKAYDISFVGGLSGIHLERTRLLETLARKFNVAVWGYGSDNLPEDSAVRKRFGGQIWGLNMYQALSDAKLVFNGHSDLIDRYFANNMRLYEATGVGTALLTDYKPNLPDLFLPNQEVIAYHDAEECVEMAGYYLEHEAERVALAEAGQQRTLREHTYHHRMEELSSILHPLTQSKLERRGR